MRRALIASITVLVAGCGGGDGDDGTVESDRLPLVFEREGGFGYTHVILNIDEDGDAELSIDDLQTVEDPIEFTLGDQQLADLEQTLEENPIDGFEEPNGNGVCADCYSYRLAYGGETYEATDADVDPDATELLETLGAIAEDHRPPPPGAMP